MTSCGFCCSSGPQSESKGKRNNKQISTSCQKTKSKQTVEHGVTVIPLVLGEPGTVPKGLKKRLGNRISTFLRSARILKRVLET